MSLYLLKQPKTARKHPMHCIVRFFIICGYLNKFEATYNKKTLNLCSVFSFVL